MGCKTWLYLFSIVHIILHVHSYTMTELIFELPSSATECFYEQIDMDTEVYIKFQIANFRDPKFDVSVLNPNKEVIYHVENTDEELHSKFFTTEEPGVYGLCFSNPAFAFSHKSVYLYFQAGDDWDYTESNNQLQTPLTELETISKNIHKSLNDLEDYQLQRRIFARKDKKFVKNINKRIQWWSILQSFVIVVVGVGQVYLLRKFFSGKKTLESSSFRR